jgi:hypothetical protein
MATAPARRSLLLPDTVAGYRVGWFPGPRLAFVEGHPRSVGLCAPAQLGDAFQALERQLADVGLVFTPSSAHRPWRPATGDGPQAPGFAGVRRLDLTVDLRFGSGAEGLAVLAGVAAFPLPRVQTRVYRQPGGRAVETVALHGRSGRRLLGRWYDKGVESGAAPRGELLRPEDQRRFDGRSRLPLEAATPEACRGLFQQRFLPLWKATKEVKVATSTKLVERVHELVLAGELAGVEGERLIGHLVADEAALAEELVSRATCFRRRARCRELGLVLADGVTDEVEVDLHAVLERALEAEDWYRC